VYYALDYRYLVDEWGSVSDARGVLWRGRGLVQTARKPGLFAVFLWASNHALSSAVHQRLVQSARRPQQTGHRLSPCALGSGAFLFYDLMNAITPTEKKSPVVVVDDHPVLCDGLKHLISNQPDLACVGVAGDLSDARRLVEKCNPDLMILDLRLKGGDALDFIKTLRVECPQTKVLVLSQYDELIFAERSLRAGASGYIMKENTTDEVLRAVRKVLAGELYFSERVAAAVVQRTLREKPNASRAGVERLSDREMQVFQLLAAAYSPREIADEFHLSRKTIETHREKIKHKLSLFNAAELKRFAREWGAENLTPFEPCVVSSSQNGRSRK
jgi:DNA-binding NarL/FixJ family response regulator